MEREDVRQSGKGYCIQVMQINGDIQEDLFDKSIHIDNISKGGFRFTTDLKFELEDRVQVILKFPDNKAKEVLGRICYCEDAGSDNSAYGFSVLRGFYHLAA